MTTKAKKDKPTPVRDLSCECVGYVSREQDYDGKQYNPDGNGEGWESYEASRCENCGTAYLSGGEGECKCGGHVPETEGPMMNYFYPLPGEPDDLEAAAVAIVDLPLCIVRVGSEYGLALTGGGMDLSWEICEAYMRLGYLPPLDFCHLPGLAGKRLTPRTKWVLDGCERSAKVAEGWAALARSKVRELRLKMRNAKI